MYFAHSLAGSADTSGLQTLQKHVAATAGLSAGFAAAFGAEQSERFYETQNHQKADRNWPDLAQNIDALVAVRAKAPTAPGLFTLTVPTGGGKILARIRNDLPWQETGY